MQLSTTLNIGAPGINQVYLTEWEKTDPQCKWLVGNEISTTDQYIRLKEIAPFSPAQQYGEGVEIGVEDPTSLAARDFYPVIVAKMRELTEIAEYTANYGALAKLAKSWAKSFAEADNINAAALYNTGFSDNGKGMVAEALFSTSHALMGTGSNRPSTDVALSPLTIEQGITEVRKLRDAKGNRMPFTGGMDLVVPPSLGLQADRYVNSAQLASSANNDINVLKGRVRVMICDYLTSDTAWFLKPQDASAHGLLKIKQKPWRMRSLGETRNLTTPIVASESYIYAWRHWVRLWGTTGA
jgi:hypothetical protein